MLLATDGITLLVVVVLALAIVIIVPRMLRRKRATSERPFGRISTDSSAKNTMEDLIVQLHDVGRELKAQLDTKMKTLDILIQEADRKIQSLRVVLDKETAEAAPPHVAAVTQSPPPAENLSKEQLQVYQLSDAGESIVNIARRTSLQPGEIELILELRKKSEGLQDDSPHR
ncbi:MAG: hypothetical protein ABIH04_00625 [Planctomycetota bacterium]